MHLWFETEISNVPTESVDTFEITETGVLNGSNKNRIFAIKLYTGLMNLKKAFAWFNKRL